MKKYSNYITLASSAALTQAFLLLISPIITRLYGPEDVGGFSVILGFGALIGSVGTGRLEHAIPVARNSIEAVQIAMLGMVLVSSASALAAIVLLAMSAMGGGNFWRNFPFFAIPIIAFSLAFFQLVNALLLRQRAFQSVGANKIYQGAVTGGAQLLLGWAALGASGLIWAQALGYLSGGARGLHRVLVRGIVVMQVHGARLRDTFVLYRRFPLVLAPAALFNQAAQHLPVLALGYSYGLYEAGLYALVMRVCGAPLGLLGQVVAQVYASEFRDHLNSGQGGRLARKYIMMLLRLLAIGTLVVALLVLIMNLWGTWLFGMRWANIGVVSLLVSVMLISDFATTPVSMTLGYLGHEKTQLTWDVCRLIAIVCVFVSAHYGSMRFGQLLLLLAVVWSLSLLFHAWLTYRACCLAVAVRCQVSDDKPV